MKATISNKFSSMRIVYDYVAHHLKKQLEVILGLEMQRFRQVMQTESTVAPE